LLYITSVKLALQSKRALWMRYKYHLWNVCHQTLFPLTISLRIRRIKLKLAAGLDRFHFNKPLMIHC